MRWGDCVSTTRSCGTRDETAGKIYDRLRVRPAGADTRRGIYRALEQPLLVPEQMGEGGGLVQALAVEAARQVRSAHGTEIILVAGRRLDQLLETLHQHGRLEARLVAPDGAEIAGPPEGWTRARRYPTSVLQLAGADRVVRAELELAVTDDEFRQVLDGILQGATWA